MKKNFHGVFIPKKHLIRIMKIYSLLICITIAKLFSSTTYSQNISIHLDKVTLQNAIKEIEGKSEYHFFYNNNLIDISKKVSLKAKNERIEKILRELLSDTNINFKIYKNQIVLFPKNVKSTGQTMKNLIDLVAKNSRSSIVVNSPPKKSTVQNKVSGTVISEEGLPLPGVNVVVKNSNKGTLTDFDGKYSLEANIGDTLVFSYVGFTTEEVIINTRTVNITLKADVSDLGEVVVTGYAVQRKSRVTGAAVTVKADLIQGNPRSVIQESLQGSVAGLQIVSGTGQPGVNPDVRIRGTGSFDDDFGDGNDTSAPLYILDGLQVSSATIASINPGDVVNITVLKDAASTSIYGARGANGVIVVTTAKGKAGKTVVRYSTQTGFSSPTVASQFKPLSTPELQELLTEGAINAGFANNQSEALQFIIDNANFNPDVNTDWYDEIIRTGVYTQHDLSISGGGDNTQFFLSGGYFNQEGVVASSDFERMNARLRINHKLNDRIKFDANLSYNKDITNTRPDGGNDENPIRALYRVRSDQSVFNPDGSFNLSFNDEHNPLALAEAETRRDIRHRILGGFNGEFQIAKGLSLQGLVSMNTTVLDEFIRLPATFSDSADFNGIGEQDTDILFDYTARGLIRYTNTFGENHSITAFGGYEVTKSNDKRTDIEVNQILDTFNDLENATQPIEASTRTIRDGINSVFINGEYSFNDTYLISGSLRRDGSSRFSDANQFGTFWSVGLGWNLAKENFMQNQNIFNDLKFRGSYGINGNDNIRRNGFLTTFSTNNYNDLPGFFFQQLGNPDLKWEENKTLDLGLDFSLFNSRIRGTFDWYTRTTDGLLRERQISAVNASLFITENIGEVENSGYEIELNTKNIVSSNGSGFEWDTDLTFSTNKNEVKILDNTESGLPIINGTSIIAVGEDINSFFLPIYAGVDPANGEALWYTDGTRTEVTNNYGDAERAIAGNASPDFYAALRNTFRYKGFTLGFQFYSSWGGNIYDTWGRFTNSDGSRANSPIGNVNRGTFERRWRQPGDVTDVPAFVFGNSQTGESNQASTRFLYDGSYVRLREVELAYTFQPDVISRLSLTNLKMYLKANNLWTYIHDDRLERDPEAGLRGRLDQNIPLVKTIFFGLDLSF